MPSREIETSQICLLTLFAKIKFSNMYLNAIRENKILAKISGLTVKG